MGQLCCAPHQRLREDDDNIDNDNSDVDNIDDDNIDDDAERDRISEAWDGDYNEDTRPEDPLTEYHDQRDYNEDESSYSGYNEFEDVREDPRTDHEYHDQRDKEEHHNYDCTERDPLLPKRNPRTYGLRQTAPPLLNQLEEGAGDHNRRTPDVPISPPPIAPAHHDGDPYSLEKLARRDPHAVQLETYPPGQYGIHHYTQRQARAHSHDLHLPHTLHHGAQERDPRDSIQDHSPIHVQPQSPLMHITDDEVPPGPPALQPEPGQNHERPIHGHRGNVNVTEMHTPAVNLHTPLFDEMSSSLRKI